MPNSAPIAVADSVSVLHDQPLNVDAPGVLGNDYDADGDPITAVQVTDATHGSAILNSDGSFWYQPDPGYVGSDSFSYQAFDGSAYSNTVDVTITISDQAPVANPDTFEIHQGLTLNVPVDTGVLANDSDPDSQDTLTAIDFTQPANGYLTPNSDGSFSYQPNPGFTGDDSFTYQASDGAETSGTVEVTINVTDTAPVAKDFTFDVHQAQELDVGSDIGVLSDAYDDDGDAMQAVPVSGPSNGSLILNEDGSFSYTPDSEFTGTDTFTYQVSDGALTSTTATVTLNVYDNAPVLGSDLSYTVPVNQSMTLNNLIGNASDQDGDSPSITISTNPSHGTLSIDGNGTYVYTPDTDYTGSDSFTYFVSDGYRDSDTVTVSLDVTNDALIANPLVLSTFEYEEAVFTPDQLLAGAVSQVSTPTLDSIGSPSHGTLTVDGDGNYHYVPDNGFTGTDTISFSVTDGVNIVASYVTMFVQQTSTATIDFANLNGVASDGRVRLTLTAADGTRTSILVNYTAGQTAGTNAAGTFAAAFRQAGWNVTRNGTEIIITSHITNNQRSPITRIDIFDGGIRNTGNRPIWNSIGDVVVTAHH